MCSSVDDAQQDRFAKTPIGMHKIAMYSFFSLTHNLIPIYIIQTRTHTFEFSSLALSWHRPFSVSAMLNNVVHAFVCFSSFSFLSVSRCAQNYFHQFSFFFSLLAKSMQPEREGATHFLHVRVSRVLCVINFSENWPLAVSSVRTCCGCHSSAAKHISVYVKNVAPPKYWLPCKELHLIQLIRIVESNKEIRATMYSYKYTRKTTSFKSMKIQRQPECILLRWCLPVYYFFFSFFKCIRRHKGSNRWSIASSVAFINLSSYVSKCIWHSTKISKR